MKKTLYLMRHGQTLFNVQHKIQGWCDAPLTELGMRVQVNILKITILHLIMLILLHQKELVIL